MKLQNRIVIVFQASTCIICSIYVVGIGLDTLGRCMQLAQITWHMARSRVKRCRDLSGGNVSLLKDLTEAPKVGIRKDE